MQAPLVCPADLLPSLPSDAPPLPPPSPCYQPGQILAPSQEWIYRNFCGNHSKMLGSMPRRRCYMAFLISLWKQIRHQGHKNVVIPTKGSHTFVGTPKGVKIWDFSFSYGRVRCVARLNSSMVLSSCYIHCH